MSCAKRNHVITLTLYKRTTTSTLPLFQRYCERSSRKELQLFFLPIIVNIENCCRWQKYNNGRFHWHLFIYIGVCRRRTSRLVKDFPFAIFPRLSSQTTIHQAWFVNLDHVFAVNSVNKRRFSDLTCCHFCLRCVYEGKKCILK